VSQKLQLYDLQYTFNRLHDLMIFGKLYPKAVS